MLHNKKLLYIFVFILIGSILFLLVCGIFFYFRIDSSISSITSLPSSNSYLFLGSNVSNIENCQTEKIGVIQNTNYHDPLNYLTENQQIKIEYQEEKSLNTLALALQRKEIGCAIIDKTSYEELSENHYLKQKTTILYEHVNNEQSDSPIFNTTTHILLSGIDSLGSAKINTRSDMNLIASVNLQRKEILLTSIPRDAYIKNYCLQQKGDKLTHTSNQGIQCTISALEDLLAIEIPYYVRISFSSVIEGANILGGLEIDVPMNFCEYDEYKRVIYLKKGKQTLNGSQVLALARHRYTLVDGDMARNRNQQLILEALIQKTKSFTTIFLIEDILKLVEKTVHTNFAKEEIYQLLYLQSQDMRPFTIHHQSISGYGEMKYTASIPNIKVSVLELSKNSLNSAKKQIKEMEEDISLANFTYSINKHPKIPTLDIKQGLSTCHIH